MPHADAPVDLGVLLGRWLTERSGATAIRSAHSGGWLSLRWDELAEAIDRAAAGARALLSPHGPVVTIVDNSLQSIPVLLGLWRAGVDTLLLEPSSSHFFDAASAIWRSGATEVVGPDGWFQSGTPDLAPLISYTDLLAGGRPGGERGGMPPERDPLVLQLTSGVTGEPRIVVHPLANLVRGGLLYVEIHDIRPADCVLVPVPFAHSFGVVGGLLAGLCAGSEVATMSRLQLRRLDEAASRPRTIMLGTPLLYRLATTAAAELTARAGTVRSALCSGGPLPAAMSRAVRDWLGRDVLQVYGSTETGLISCEYATTEPWPAESVGLPAPGVVVRLGTPSAESGAGELLVRTSTMFEGYHGYTWADDFYDTGDLARQDAVGRIYLVGRKATFINVGGRKVNPVRIGRLLQETGMVRDVAVYGVDRGDTDQEIHVAVELAAGATLADLRHACRQLLAPYEIPHAIHVMDQLPRGSLGKVERDRLPH